LFEFTKIILNSTSIKRIILISLGVVLFACVNYMFPFLIAFWPELQSELKLYFYLVSIVLASVLAIWGTVVFENQCRRILLSLFQNKLTEETDSRQTWLTLEAVNYTGSIEKFVWSFTDTIKAFLTVLLGFLAASLSNPNGLLISVLAISSLLAFQTLTLRYASSVRYRSQKITKQFVTLMKSTLSPEEETKQSLRNIGKTRIALLYWRSTVTFIATLIGFGLILTGVYLLQTEKILGAAAMLSGIFVGGAIKKLTQSYTVSFGEAVHFKEMLKQSNDRINE